MNLFHDLPPLAAPPARPKLTPEEIRAREADRLASNRLRMAIIRKLDEQGITDPHAVALAFCMRARDADKLLIRHRWREGDAVLLQAAAARLGVQVPDP
jgi:hypothetical protein